MNYVILSCLLYFSVSFDVQRHQDHVNILKRMIALAKTDKINQYFDEDMAKCATATCCNCGLEFRNATYSGIHYVLYHLDDEIDR